MKHFAIQSIAFLMCAVLLGCSNQEADSGDDHSHGHDHDHSAEAQVPFDSLVEQICQHRDSIKSAFDADNHDEAHDPLHEIGHLITQLPDAASQTDLAESDWNQVKGASDKLMEAFGKIDMLFHGDESGVKFPEVEQEIATAITVLEEKVAMLPAKAEETH